jgi:hypothetical protein
MLSGQDITVDDRCVFVGGQGIRGVNTCLASALLLTPSSGSPAECMHLMSGRNLISRFVSGGKGGGGVFAEFPTKVPFRASGSTIVVLAVRWVVERLWASVERQ